MKFVSEAVVPQGDFDGRAVAHGEPALPTAFAWRDEILTIAAVVRTSRGLKEDRGDTYLKRHTYEVELTDGRAATFYFERQAKPGQPRWWLYTISATSAPGR